MATDEAEILNLIESLRLRTTGDGGFSKACRKIAGIRDVRGVQPLIECLDDVEVPRYRRNEAAVALVQIGDLRGIAAVLNTAGGLASVPNMAVFDNHVVSAMRVLLRLDPFDLREFRVVSGDLDWVIPAQLVAALTEVLRRAGDPTLRVMAALALAVVKDDDRVIEALREAMEDDDAVFVEFAGFAIPVLGMPQQAFIVGEVAAYSLVVLGDKESLAEIVPRVLRHWSVPRPKEQFFRYMRVLGWESVVSELTTFAEKDREGDPRIRARAVSCLAAIGDAEAIEALTRTVKDPHKDVRKRAVEALGEIGDSSVLEALALAKQDQDRSVRKAADKATKSVEKRLG